MAELRLVELNETKKPPCPLPLDLSNSHLGYLIHLLLTIHELESLNTFLDQL